jgi:hypothetical protein
VIISKLTWKINFTADSKLSVNMSKISVGHVNHELTGGGRTKLRKEKKKAADAKF